MKTVIVTGATGGLGKAIVQKFLNEGATVIGTTTKKTATPFDGQPGFEAYTVDLSSEKESNAFIAAVVKKYPVIDVAVLTAGGFAMGKIEETGMDEIMKQYDINFTTTYNVARAVFTQMLLQKSGRIFLTGSKPGLDMKLGKGMTAYALSKSLVFRLAELMNEEAKNTSVVTHVIVPSTIDTAVNRNAMPDADFSKWVKAESIADIVHTYCEPSFDSLREAVIKVYNKS
ncbi:SDR family NAD(P)-dependent oxidoreductase [Terrimonas sp. NA20]|uniref:SDR family NAD(P)-dependent oxidoreductase n=1 Tax=Terrimonas ginsenosidimutans TaxID=2908004 RepID=A0ABS9KXZ6_9BACT|nr:SDR family NAD(P)-dependent oxidoreductase [Terrimonas ginsenosidimutans]MCG2617102.1 SDR family NAD(P)-dependent oxidoreductase [Terrimonas ginsenosidimutans]